MENLGYYIIENLISQKNCNFFREKILSESKKDISNPRKNFLIHPSIPDNTINSKEWDPNQELNKIIKFAEKFIKNNFKLEENILELKRFFFHTMLEGARIEPHADDGDIYEGKKENEKHYSAVLVLNNDYEGGKMFFPYLKKEHKLKAGSLIIFPGDKKRTHGVETIEKGLRISMPIFFKNYTNNE